MNNENNNSVRGGKSWTPSSYRNCIYTKDLSALTSRRSCNQISNANSACFSVSETVQGPTALRLRLDIAVTIQQPSGNSCITAICMQMHEQWRHHTGTTTGILSILDLPMNLLQGRPYIGHPKIRNPLSQALQPVLGSGVCTVGFNID